MKVADLVYRKSTKLDSVRWVGLIVEIIGDVAIVFWPHRNKTAKYYFHLLEKV